MIAVTVPGGRGERMTKEWNAMFVVRVALYAHTPTMAGASSAGLRVD